MSSRFVTPGLAARSARTARGPVSESVTARATLRRTTSGGSSRWMTPGPSAATCPSSSVGSARSITRAPAAGVVTSGIVNTGP